MKMPDGYYGLYVVGAYTKLEDALPNKKERRTVPKRLVDDLEDVISDLQKVPMGAGYLVVDDEDFLVLHKMADGSAVGMRGMFKDCAETPGEAFVKALKEVQDTQGTYVVRHVQFPEKRIRPPVRH